MTQAKPAIGIAFALLAYISMAACGACAKLLPDVSVITILFFQFSVSFLLTLPMAVKNGYAWIKTSHPYLMGVRCLAGVMTFAAFFASLRFIPLADASLLQNSYPIFTPLIAWLFLRKKFSYKIWLSIVIGVTGLLFVLKPSARLVNLGAILGLCSGITGAISLIAVRLLDESEPINRILFYFFLCGTLVLTPFFIANYPHLTSFSFVLLIFIGALTYCSQILNIQAMIFTGVIIVSSLGYSTVIFAGFFGWLISGYIPDKYSLFGMVLVIMGGTLATLLNKPKPPISLVVR